MYKAGYGDVTERRIHDYTPQEWFVKSSVKIMRAHLDGIFDVPGHTTVICPECEGEGEVVYECQGISFQKEIECPICDREGSVALCDLRYQMSTEEYIKLVQNLDELKVDID